MPLTRQERAELDSLRAEMAPAGLSPEERAELDSLRSEFRPAASTRQRTGSGVVPVDVEGMGTGERVLRGALGGVEDIGLGAAQMVGAAGRREARDIAERKAPLYDTTAGAIGQILPSLALPGATVPRAIAGGTAYGAMQPETEEGGRLTEALQSGAAFGAGNLAAQSIGRVASRAVSPLRGARRATPIQAARDAAAKEAEELGLQVSAGARSGSRVTQGLESVMARGPVTGGRAQRFGEENLAAANKVLAKQFGSTEPVLTKQVFAEARDRVASDFGALMKPGGKIAYDGRFMSKMKGLKDELSLLPKEMQSGKIKTIVKSLYDDILPQWSRSGVSIDGQRYSLLRSELSDQARALAKKKPSVSRQIDGVVRSLDDMAGRSLSDADQSAFKAARKQWQGLRLAEDAVDKYGNVAISKLDAAIAKHKPKAGQGRDVHRELSRSLGVVKDQIANSGTPERLQAMANMNPLSLAMSTAAGYAARPLQELLLNPQSARFLSNDAVSRLLQSQGTGSGLEALRRGAGAGAYGVLQEAYE